MTTWKDTHLLVVAKMINVPVTGKHHKQKDTIVRWCGKYDGDRVKDAIDDLITDPSAPVHEKGRGTITLRSYQEAENFLRQHDDDDDYIWYY